VAFVTYRDTVRNSRRMESAKGKARIGDGDHGRGCAEAG